MTNLRPRKIAHKGWVDAAGFLFATNLIGVSETRRRILNLWEPGVQVFTDGPNCYVLFSSIIRVDCANCVAAPLVQFESVLSALPLSEDELEVLQASSHSVVFARGGVTYSTYLSSVSAEFPEKWLDVKAFKVVQVTSLGAAFVEPKVIAEPQPFDARAKLDGVPAEAFERRKAIAAIKLAMSGRGKQSGNWFAAQELRIWFGGLIDSISSGLVRLRNSASQTGSAPRRTSSYQGAENGWLTRFGLRLLHTSHLARVLGRRQAAYIGKVMDMFERGDLTEALKHAIPLGDLSSLTQRPALGVPSPRLNL